MAQIYSYEASKIGGKTDAANVSEDSTQSSEALSLHLPPTASLGDIQKRKFAIKVEQRHAILLEITVLSSAKETKKTHFCELIDAGIEPITEIHFMVMTLLGPSFSEMRYYTFTRTFTFSTAIRIAMQMLHAIQELHEIGFIQRDIKPSNYAIGLEADKSSRLIHILDFGISRIYLDQNGQHLPPRFSPGWRGTSRYCSYNNHQKLDLSRKDDVESWFYAVVEMTTGALPWASFGSQFTDQIGEMKRLARTLDRCKFLDGCPEQFDAILNAIDRMRFFTRPDYDGIYVYLMRAMKERGVSFGDPYDWEKHPKMMITRKVRSETMQSPTNRLHRRRRSDDAEKQPPRMPDCAHQVIVNSVFGHQRIIDPGKADQLNQNLDIAWSRMDEQLHRQHDRSECQDRVLQNQSRSNNGV